MALTRVLPASKCSYQAPQSWISFFIGTSPLGITREALNIFLLKNKKITCKALIIVMILELVD